MEHSANDPLWPHAIIDGDPYYAWVLFEGPPAIGDPSESTYALVRIASAVVSGRIACSDALLLDIMTDDTELYVADDIATVLRVPCNIGDTFDERRSRILQHTGDLISTLNENANGTGRWSVFGRNPRR